MMDTSIFDFLQLFYLPIIKKLSLNLPHVRIIGKNHCGNSIREEFKCCADFHNVLCHQNYAECVVDSFAQPIKYQ